jgi:multidrug efflux pump subunit AcrA (membrane-fusion protein)
MPPTVVLVIEDHSQLEIRFRIPELDLKTIDKGTELEAHFPAVDETRTVTVSRIGASVDVRTRSIEIIAKVDNADGRLKPGMSTEVKAVRDAAEEPPAETVDAAVAKQGAGDDR